jgi:hypothetical protein
VNPEIVFVAGASGFRDVGPEAALLGVILSYSKAVDGVFYLTVGAAAAAFVIVGDGGREARNRRLGRRRCEEKRI